ncbi:D-alanine--D-alanine ligase family protein [Spiribacter halobius]|uniref:D-alanine--D-alanine ligase n=1 Tax=Sediminicurvatus halobius TaxID=2182432 RepID=A0A2U2MZW4_9GAMM|nr:ATP-grasp domain-containing protein [Spiribacter halobius]PWG62352.1 D-alanine--D-alanine ligase [Spiribacter halobius]UEX79725.1 ATP-grasp domain-containing protein [Spiribacter halobius]
MTDATLDVALLAGDPHLPYEYGVDGRFGEDEQEAVGRARDALAGLPGLRVRLLDDHDRLIDQLRAEPPQLAVNFCDTGYRNRLALEPNVPALLELLDVPYTGSGPACMGICADKALVRHLAVAQGVPVPNETLVDLQSDPLPLPELYPALIKPNDGCGSQGVTPDCVVHDAASADAWLRQLASNPAHDRALIQDFLTGPEYTVGLVGNAAQGLEVLPILEVDYSRLPADLPPILSYGSKVDPESPYWQALRFREAELPEAVRAQMVDQAAWLFGRLGFRDYARIDFRAGADGVPRLLDANFNPTWSWDGKLAMMAGWAGWDYAGLLQRIVDAARARHGL